MAEPTHDEHLTQIRDRSRRLAEIPLETSASNYIMRDMIDSIGDVRWLLEQLERQQTLAATVAEPMSDERLAELDAWMGPDSLQGRLGGKGSDWAMEAELVTEVKRLNTVLDANRVVRNAAESSSRTYKAVVDRLKAERTELRAEIDRLRAQLAEIGERIEKITGTAEEGFSRDESDHSYSAGWRAAAMVLRGFEVPE